VTDWSRKEKEVICRVIDQQPTTMDSLLPSSSSTATKGPPPLLVPEAEASSNEPEEWLDVVHTGSTECNSNFAYKTNLGLSRLPPDRQDVYEKHLAGGDPSKPNGVRLELKSDQAYKVRVAAVNSLGMGPWSEVVTYRANKPGFLGAPTKVKVNRTADGVFLCWDPPETVDESCHTEDYEYSVFIGMNKPGESNSTMQFEAIYSGVTRSCLVTREQLSKARIDRNSQPCILFRISVKSGDLQSTMQVRWLQDLTHHHMEEASQGSARIVNSSASTSGSASAAAAPCLQNFPKF